MGLNRWTPCEIEVLLKVFYSNDKQNGIPDTNAHHEARAMWKDLGCIRWVDGDMAGRYRTTPRGDLLIERLRHVQLPRETNV